MGRGFKSCSGSFMALPQRGYTSGFDPEADDRTPEQKDRFHAGLSSISIFYSHKYTYTICLDGPLPPGAVNTAPYAQRGWCIFERLLSSLVKNCNCFLQLSLWETRGNQPNSLLHKPGVSNIERAAQQQSWFEIISTCAADREPPMPPDAFTEMMLTGVEKEAAAPGSGIRFTCGKDLTDVILPQYSSAFLRLMGEATELDYSSLGWVDADMDTLTAALTYAATRSALGRLSKLDLYSNELTDEGALKLVDALKQKGFVAPMLKQIVLTRNNIRRKATRDAIEKALGASAGTADVFAPTGVGLTRGVARGKAMRPATAGSAPVPSTVSNPGVSSSEESRGSERVERGVFTEGAPPAEGVVAAVGKGKDVLILRIGNTHHDEQATKGPLGGNGRHHWCAYVEPRWASAGSSKSSAEAAKAVEWVEFELHPTFRQRFKMVKHANGKSHPHRFEFSAAGWGAFEIELKVKVVGMAIPHAFTWFLHLERSEEGDFHEEYCARVTLPAGVTLPAAKVTPPAAKVTPPAAKGSALAVKDLQQSGQAAGRGSRIETANANISSLMGQYAALGS